MFEENPSTTALIFQIVPERPTPVRKEDDMFFTELEIIDLTQEELELQEDFEQEESINRIGDLYEDNAGGDFEQQESEGEAYFARTAYSQVDSTSLESMHRRIEEQVSASRNIISPYV